MAKNTGLRRTKHALTNGIKDFSLSDDRGRGSRDQQQVHKEPAEKADKIVRLSEMSEAEWELLKRIFEFFEVKPGETRQNAEID